ncbi:MAG: 30S ribosomal protein S6e [Candidatus Bathyarchaeia archaeon]
MAKFKIIVSDPETGRSKSVEIEGARAIPLIGKRIGDTVDGSLIGMPGTKLLITGGSDKDGFPMRPDIYGGVKTEVLLSGGVGYKPKNKGERRRKTIRGNMITEDTVQINMKIIKEKTGEGD